MHHPNPLWGGIGQLQLSHEPSRAIASSIAGVAPVALSPTCTLAFRDQRADATGEPEDARPAFALDLLRAEAE